MKEYRKKRLILIIILITGILALSFLDELLLDSPVRCLHKEITGYRCPLCGFSHAIHYFFGFRFSEAFKEHPVVFLFVLYTLTEFIAFIYPAALLIKIRNILIVVMLAGLACVYLLRCISVL